MRKLRSDARWHGFSAAQQEQIQQWLFVEHLSYATVRERIRAELGISCALSTIGPLYHYLKESRSQVKEAMLQKLTEVITEPGTDLAAVKADSLQVITNRLLVRSEFSKRNGEFVKLSQVMARGDACDVARERLELRRDIAIHIDIGT